MPTAGPSLASLLAALRDAETAGDARGAIALAEQAVAAHPDEPAPWFLLCRLLLLARDERAAALLPRLERFPSFAPGWEEIGTTLLSQSKPAAAHVAFARAIAHAPDRARAHLGRAAAFEAERRHADAAAALARAEALMPDAWELAYRRGLMLRECGALAEACEALERATAHPEASATAWHALGITCQDLDDAPAAVSAYRRALALRADFHEAALNLGAALQDAGDFDAALDAYAIAYRLAPESFGRIAQATTSSRTGRLFVDPERLRGLLAARA